MEEDKEMMSRLMVAVRVRPISQKELSKDNVAIIARALDDKTILIVDPMEDWSDDVLRKDRPKEKLYSFDYVFSESATQMNVYEKTVRFLISYVLEGFNATVFAYGATGAGKTFTMLGTESKPGIMALTLADLFNKIAKEGTARPQESYEVSMTYLEIYNENIRDLLSGKPDLLDLREDAFKGVVVAGITSVQAQSAEEVMMFLRKGNKNRSQEPTGANEVSSRSHAVLQVLVTMKSKDAQGNRIERYGKLSMIDLAGSERAAETNNRGLRMIEGANINRSLLALGNCINALGETGKRGKYVNYRDSKLTRLLKDSLGGNCRTVMIANISPSSSNFDETTNTLKYASRARTIKTKISQQVQYKLDEYNNALSQMRAGSGSLKNKLEHATNGVSLPRQLRTRTSTNHDSISSQQTNSKWFETNHKSQSVTAKRDDKFGEAYDNLEATMAEQLVLRNRLLDVDTTDAQTLMELQRVQVEAEDLKKQLQETDSREQEKRKIIEEELELKNNEVDVISQTREESNRLKISLNAEISELDQKMKVEQQSLDKAIDSKGRQCLALRMKAHYTEMENLDLNLAHTLSSSIMEQKSSELQLIYRLIDLYEEIIAVQLKERTTPIPAHLKGLLASLEELKVKLGIVKSDDKTFEFTRKKVQLQSLNERIALRISRMSTQPVLPPIPRQPSMKEESSSKAAKTPLTKKPNILASGFAKLLGRKSPSSVTEESIPVSVPHQSDPIIIHPSPALLATEKSEIRLQPSESISVPPSPGSSRDRESRVEEPSNNLAQQSQFSKSLQFLEKQVVGLVKAPQSSKIDYVEQFKTRNQERVVKLNNATPNSMSSEMTWSATLYEGESARGSYSSLSMAGDRPTTNGKKGADRDGISIPASKNKQPNQIVFSTNRQPGHLRRDDSTDQDLTESEKRVEQKRAKEAKILDMFGSKSARQALMEHAYGTTDAKHKTKFHDADGKHRLQPVLHSKGKDNRSRRPTDEVRVA